MWTLSLVQILALIYNLGIVQMWNVSFPRGNISKCWLQLLLVNTLVKWLELIWQKKIVACQNQLNSLSSTSTATGQFRPFCCIVPFILCPWLPWLSFCTYINQIQLNINVWYSLQSKPHQIPHTNQMIWLFAHYCLLFCTITILCTRNLLKLVTVKFMQKLNFTAGALALGGDI